MIKDIWRSVLTYDENNQEEFIVVDEKEEIINFFIENRIDPELFISNYIYLVNSGQWSSSNKVNVNYHPTNSIVYHASIFDRAPMYPFWFLAAYPDVVKWLTNWQDEFLKAHQGEFSYMNDEMMSKFGVHSILMQTDSILNDNEKCKPEYLRNLANSYQQETGKKFETMVIPYSENDIYEGSKYLESIGTESNFTLIAENTTKYYLTLKDNYRDSFSTKAMLLATAGVIDAGIYIFAEKSLSVPQVIEMANQATSKLNPLLEFIILLENKLLRLDSHGITAEDIEIAVEINRDVIDKTIQNITQHGFNNITQITKIVSYFMESSEYNKYRDKLGISDQYPNDQANNYDTKQIQEVHPWSRYWARTFDIFLFSLFSLFILFMIAPAILGFNEVFLSIFLMFCLVFAEAVFLSTFGYTPGKYLLGVSVREENGTILPFSTALNRSFAVWLKGVGLGIPLVTIFTQCAGYNQLKTKGITTWDRDLNIVVSHQSVGGIRIALAVLVGIVIITSYMYDYTDTPTQSVYDDLSDQQELLDRHNKASSKIDELFSTFLNEETVVYEVITANEYGKQTELVKYCQNFILDLQEITVTYLTDIDVINIPSIFNETPHNTKNGILNSISKIKLCFEVVDTANDAMRILTNSNRKNSLAIVLDTRADEILLNDFNAAIDQYYNDFIQANREMVELFSAYNDVLIFLESKNEMYHFEDNLIVFDNLSDAEYYNKLLDEYNLQYDIFANYLNEKGGN